MSVVSLLETVPNGKKSVYKITVMQIEKVEARNIRYRSEVSFEIKTFKSTKIQARNL